MSNPSETSGRPLSSQLPHQQEQHPTQQSSAPLNKRRRSSQSSDDRVGGTKSPSSRRRPSARNEASFRPHAGTSRGDSSTMQHQRSTSPGQMSPEGQQQVNYTRTGRISKAKKGLKVHNCEACGKSYTRAEHLRRHQRNHNPDAQVCDFPDCGKTFHRPDLLQRHRERHAMGKDSPQTPFNDTGDEPNPRRHSAGPTGVTNTPSTGPYVQTPPHYPASTYQQDAAGRSVKQPAHSAPGTQGAAGTVSITVDGNPSYPPWNEPFSPYTPSSSYPSPIPAAGDLSTFPTPYGGSVRGTREPSIAEPSFEPSPWVYAPQSPTSATSPLVLWGPSTEKSPVPPGTIFPHSSFSMTSPAIPTSLELGPGFMGGHYPTMRSLAERDEDDQRMLFPDQYGMGHIPETYPLEQYSDNYWRLFHPAFPILHKPTYGSLTESPMLRAAILAIGAQYSTDACAKRKARILVDRCLKRLEMRDLEPTAEPPRLCDYQAIFLLEVLAQYRARRAAPGLSRRFEEMYLKFANECNPHDMSGILDNISSLNPDGDWIRWIDLSSQQRLLQCCYILETQQTTLLARTHTRSLINNTGYNLPFPVPTDLWDAQNANAWAMTASQYGHLPSTLYEMNQMGAPALDRFQSSFLIAAHYNHFENPSPYLSPSRIQDIDHLVDSSLITQHHLLTAKLLQATPIRELLAVSGESWILSEKVTSMRSFSDYRSTVKTWVTKLWNTNADSGSQIVKDALKAAVSILRQALLDEDLSVEFGVEMGLYYAVLVIWAVTVAATTRTRPNNQQVRHPSPHPLSSHRASHYPSASVHLTPANSNSPSPLHNNAMGGGIPQPTPSSSPSPLLNLTPEFSSQCLNFLDLAVFDLDLIHSVPNWPGNVSQWQQGCVQLLRWTKLRLRNGQPENRDGVVPGQGPTSAAGTATNGRGCGGDSLGELLDCVVANLEKLSGRGWEGWGF